MNRRAFLKLGMGTSSLLLAGRSWPAETGEAKANDEELLAESKDQIERYRKGDGLITVRDGSGRPVPRANVRVEQLRHDFLFGCNFFMFGRCGAPDLEEQYRQRFAALLNYCTLGFYWAYYEPERGKPNREYTDQVVEWTKQHGITCKGHPLVWDHPAGSPKWLPDDPAEIDRLSKRRVHEIVARYKNRIDIWDVVNEATHLADKVNQTRMANWAAALGAVRYVAEHLSAARSANPQANLLVNDYRIEPRYYGILDSLREAGKCLFDTVGIQSHMHGGVWRQQRLKDVCEQYSKLGRPIHFTETTIVSGPRNGPGENWGKSTAEEEAKQAAQTEQFYRTLFAQPAVGAITWWDFSDRGAWQGAPAGWLRRDMSPKPVYERLVALIKREWWTQQEGRTDARGQIKLRAFFGSHRLTAQLSGGQESSKEVQWQPGKKNEFELIARSQKL